jgi:hypothetical protein
MSSRSERRLGPRACSIADVLGVVRERWSLLVVRELGFGVHRFTDIQVNTGAPRETLALRLRTLEEAGLSNAGDTATARRGMSTCSPPQAATSSLSSPRCASGASAMPLLFATTVPAPFPSQTQAHKAAAHG